MATAAPNDDDFLERLRRELPRLLKGRPDVRAEVAALLADHLTSREETREILDEIRALREESNRRFEAVDRRFEAVDRRFEELIREMNARFEALVRDMNERFEAVYRRMDDQQDWVGIVVGGFQRRAGRSLEDAVAGTLRMALRMRDIRPEDVRLRQKLVEEEGLIGPPGKTYEYDLLVHNGAAYAFEVKSVAEPEHAERIARKARLAARALGREVQPVLVALDRPADLVAACAEHGVRLA